jgi:tricorn protease
MRILFLTIFLISNFSLTSQESLWIRYPQISPDGKKIVFSYQGDLFEVPSEGGRALPLTTHPSHEMMPIFSPDGQSLAFASDRNGNYDVYTMPAQGGPAKRLSFHSSSDYPTSFSPNGKEIYFYSSRRKDATAVFFPSGVMPELYKVSKEGGRERQVSTTPMVNAQIQPTTGKILFEDIKGYENAWRKHHTSSVTRDIFVYDPSTDQSTKLTTFEGEDRNPVWIDEDQYYYLSEQSGHFNVWKASISQGKPEQITFFQHHPVRFLSISDQGTLAFSWHGELYTLQAGDTPKKVRVEILRDGTTQDQQILPVSSGATEMALSPNEKEIAFVHRGEIFVTSIEHNTTKRITQTPEEERNISFSPDGRSLLFAAERGGIWGIYEVSLAREEEKYFALSTKLEEKTLVFSDKDAFQPAYSPNGKEIAFLENRVVLRVLDKASSQIRTVMDERYNFSYSDGDQHYEWSPDGLWFLVHYKGQASLSNEVGLVKADGSQTPINLTKSGYADNQPRWMNKGNLMIWFSDKNGYRSHGSWGSESDVYAMFFTKGAWDQFKMSKEELELYKEREKEKEKDLDKEKDEKKKKGESKEAEQKELAIDWEGLDNRVARLTLHSSPLSDAVLSPDGEQLFYLTRFEKGYDLWVHKLYDKETKLLAKLNKGGGKLHMDKEGKNIFLLANGQIMKISADKGDVKNVSFSSEMVWQPRLERAYIFEHAWRQFRDKFYLEDLHGIDWDFYKEAYLPFLPHITNNQDFAEMLSEMLGEANASHTGAGYRRFDSQGDQTASLGLFFDETYQGPGLKIEEVMDKSPVLKEDSRIKAGHVVLAIDGQTLEPDLNHFPLLNRKAGQLTLLEILDPKTQEKWEEVVRPIGKGAENELLYQRWIKQRRHLVDSLSNQTLGYVHVRGMNSQSFREVYSEVLGRYHDRKALIVDTRFNGGGWLHDDLATFLSGVQYTTFSPRGNEILGGDPMGKWNKPSCVLVSESNYSDAHMFPYVYQTLNLGKVIGMPVPGTGTAVWWETQIDNTLYFGIPQLGVKDIRGNYLENQQLYPDIEVWNDYDAMRKGQDPQLLKAVETMLAQ